MSRPEAGGSSSGTSRPRRRRRNSSGGGGGGIIHTTPRPRSSGHGGGHSGGGGGGGGGGGRSGGGGGGGRSGGGGGGGGGISGAERRANAKEAEAKSKAAKRFVDQAKVLQNQLNAMRVALGPRGFKRALNIQLAGVRLQQRQQDAALRKDYHERVQSLEKVASDNQKAAGAGTFAALSNRGRERANAMSEVQAQGAGESDALRAQGAALRNWQSNQQETNRSFYDTLSSVNSSLTDLTVDTRTARMNNVVEANSDRNQLWTDYYGHRSETLTQMGNIRGQMAEYYGLANEQVSGKGYRKKQKGLGHSSASAFRRAALNTGRSWRNPGVSKNIRNWEGRNAFIGNQGSSHEVVTEVPIKAPEGATLRNWSKE